MYSGKLSAHCIFSKFVPVQIQFLCFYFCLTTNSKGKLKMNTSIEQVVNLKSQYRIKTQVEKALGIAFNRINQ